MNLYRTICKSTAKPAPVTACLLLIPLIAMQFSDEVVWTLSDFIFAGGVLLGTGVIYQLITRVLILKSMRNTVYRVALGFPASS